MIHGRLNADGSLTDISERIPVSGDVEVAVMPSGFGPYRYDAPTKTAVEVPGFTSEQRLMKRGYNKVRAAVVLRLSTKWLTFPPPKRARLQALIDDEAALIEADWGDA